MFSRLKEDIDCILERDPAARSRLEVLTCYPGLHALWIQRLAHWFWVRDFKWLGSHRYGIVHLHGDDAAHLERRARAASALLGWPAPYADRPAPTVAPNPTAATTSPAWRDTVTPQLAPEGPP